MDLQEKENSITPDDEYVKSVLPKRGADTNKGSFGKLLCVCGSKYMPGAAVLCIGSALRSGAGLVTLMSEERVIDAVCARYCEPIYKSVDWEKGCDDVSFDRYSAILVGCGLGKSEIKKQFLINLIKNADCQLIIDADGINLLSDNIDILREAKMTPVITPHPGEFARLSGYDTEYINANRIAVAREFSAKYNCITVLKGAGTVVASPDGRLGINTSGNPGLAKGGSGDVLAGLTAGLCTVLAKSGAADAFDASLCAVYIHGKAADLLKEESSEYGLLPSELEGYISKLLP